VELQARAGGLGGDRLGLHVQVLYAPDVERDVLAARVDDLFVENAVARVGRQVIQDRMVDGEGRQDADQDQPRVMLDRLFVGSAEHLQQLLLVGQEAVARDEPWWDVELQVELAQFGLEARLGEVGQDAGVTHGRIEVGAAGQIDLDLQTGHRRVCVEGEVVQHEREGVEAPAHLLPVTHPVGAAEGEFGDVLAHVPSPGRQSLE
jgi:hypothetical protein